MKIGVIGAGTMGQGIAKAFAQVEGNTVALCDIKQEWAENGLAKIKKGYEKLVAKGKMTQEKADAIVAAITPGLKEDLCADCDLVVEAAFEDMKVKQTTFGELDKICKPESLPTLLLCPSPRSARALAVRWSACTSSTPQTA